MKNYKNFQSIQRTSFFLKPFKIIIIIIINRSKYHFKSFVIHNIFVDKGQIYIRDAKNDRSNVILNWDRINEDSSTNNSVNRFVGIANKRHARIYYLLTLVHALYAIRHTEFPCSARSWCN